MEVILYLIDMFLDNFYQTHNGEIFVKTQCIYHEHALHNLLASMLGHLGYCQFGELNRQWERNRKQEFYQVRREAVVSLADSFRLCGNNTRDPEQWFGKNAVIITDNYALFKPEYTICQTPSSYFGIFNYVPKNQKFCPQRRFGLSVNRFDRSRQLILLELLNQSGGIDTVLNEDYVNFNVWGPDSNNNSILDIRKTFANAWEANSVLVPEYQSYYDQAFGAIPIRNHELTVEQAHVSAFLTLVIETYADDVVIALSEKIFRALVTPAPWTVYAAPNTVNYLRSLDFDVLDDLVDHSYDSAVNTFSSNRNEKIINYITNGFANYDNLRTQPIDQLTARCQRAAAHNQGLLNRMQQQWPADFAAWIPSVIALLQ